MISLCNLIIMCNRIVSTVFSRYVVRHLSGSKRLSTVGREYDYVVVGAGSAGCIVAHRLVTGDNSAHVLLVEAGHDRDQFWKVRMPGGTQMNIGNPELDWGFQTESQACMDGRSLYLPGGKLLGGTSAVNSMVYVRGHAADYDRWAEKEGATGWSFAECLPYFKKGQTHELGENEYRGASGPLYVSVAAARNQLHKAFIAAGLQAGYPQTDDFNGRQQEGFGRYDLNIKHGQRGSTAAMYLRPALKHSGQRLTVLPDTTVTRVVFNGKDAVGIDCQTGGKGGPTQFIRASREVILCAGAIKSPQLLMLSGIGPADHLQQHGIAPLQNLPGVGANLQDHVYVPMRYQCTKPDVLYSKQWRHTTTLYQSLVKWWLFSSGDLTSSGLESGGFVRSSPDLEYPDIQFMFFPGSWRNHSPSLKVDEFQAVACLLRPASRGHVTLKSADPHQQPAIQLNFLEKQSDLDNLRKVVKIGRKIFSQQAFDEFRGDEMLPGKRAQTDAEIDHCIRQTADSVYHPACTCAMGSPDENKMAVVDSKCRVVGVDRLRVVDASVMPSMVGGNTNAATMMIAEKVSDMILGRPPLEKAVV